MQQVPIQAIPNQGFSINLDGNQWDFLFRVTNGCMSVTITLNNIILVENVRVVAGSLLIPSQYQESGNFIFTNSNFQMPDFNFFNVTQSLIYVSASELATYRTAPTPPITASYFNPIASLPLRFAPQGYVLA